MLSKSDFDWTHARAFLATAETGSFSAAARELKLTQPTLSRQVAALEADLGVTLFERVGNGLHLTETGLSLLDHVRAMAEGADQVALTASGKSREISGLITITATDLVAGQLLPEALHRIAKVAPGLQVDILASNAVQDLRRREADISIRHLRPTEPDLIAKFLMDTRVHLYGAPTLLDRIGRPVSIEALRAAPFVSFGIESIDEIRAGLRTQGIEITADQFRFGCQAGAVAWQFVEAGLGLSLMVEEIAERSGRVERALPDMAPILVPAWLVAHREIHTSRRVRLVFDIISEVFAGLRRGTHREEPLRD